MSPLIMLRPFKVVAAGGGSGLCAGGEFDYFTNAFWTSVGTLHAQWQAGSNRWLLGSGGSNANNTWEPTGGWNVGFRPSAVKFIYTAGSSGYFDTWDFKLHDSTGYDITGGTATGISNGAGQFTVGPITLTFQSGAAIHDIGNPGGFGTNQAGMQIDTFNYSGADFLDAVCFVP